MRQRAGTAHAPAAQGQAHHAQALTGKQSRHAGAAPAAKRTPPHAVAAPAVCEDGSAPVREGEGSYSCADGSEPVCARRRRTGRPSSNGVGAVLPDGATAAAASNAAKPSCEDGSAPAARRRRLRLRRRLAARLRRRLAAAIASQKTARR